MSLVSDTLECARELEEGMALRSGDINIVYLYAMPSSQPGVGPCWKNWQKQVKVFTDWVKENT